MKRVLICLFALCLLSFSISVSAADKAKNPSDKGIGATIADDAKEVKKGTVKAVKGSKDAIIHDAKEIKESFPRDVKEAKEAGVKKSREVKEGAQHELKEIKNGLSKPLKP